MKISADHYKGIEFVRISALPEEQKRLALVTFDEKKIIKILHNEELLKDCVQYCDYQDWYDLAYKPQVKTGVELVLSDEFKLAFK